MRGHLTAASAGDRGVQLLTERMVGEMRIQVLRGSAAVDKLRDARFVESWRVLGAGCPWGTAFQSPAFAQTWYDTYSEDFEPVLVMGQDEQAALCGLMVLALGRDGELLVAGRHQAEYHGWLSTEAVAETFPPRAIAALNEALPGVSLRFHFLAAGTPLNWVRQGRAAELCFAAPSRRPLLDLSDGGAGAKASLSKGSNKSKLKRLQKMGAVEFRRVTDPVEFEALFPQIVLLWDLRHAAAHGSVGFHTTARQTEFHAALFRQSGLLHVTTMHVGGRLAAAHIGAITDGPRGRELQLGFIVHNPMWSRHSPGKLHLLMLARMLADDGYARFDLTPSGDGYKERFANGGDEVHTLLVLPDVSAKKRMERRERVRQAYKGLAKTVLNRLSINPLKAKLYVKAKLNGDYLKRGLWRDAGRWVKSREETRAYTRPLDGDALPPPVGQEIEVRRNALEDLLLHASRGSLASRQVFLAAALQHLDRGRQMYTVVRDGKLAQLVWVIPPGEADPDDAPANVAVPEGAVVIAEGCCQRPADAAMTRAVLNAILADARTCPGARLAMAISSGREGLSFSAVEAMGFECQQTTIGSTVLGMRMKPAIQSVNAPPSPGAVPGPQPAKRTEAPATVAAD